MSGDHNMYASGNQSDGGMTEEDEEFNRIEREAAMRKEAVSAAVNTQQKPLDEEWIAYCWRKSLIGTRISYREYVALIREVERAHNIK